jgi:rubredoxin
MCLICGYLYDEAAGAPGEGIAAGTRWQDVPADWTCPECGARKEDFEMVKSNRAVRAARTVAVQPNCD